MPKPQRFGNSNTDNGKADNGRNTVYSNNYSETRLGNAIWTYDKQQVDDAMRDSTGKWWNGLSQEQMDAAVDFTGGGYDGMNRLLGGRLKPTDWEYDDALKQVNDLTEALSKSSIPEDIWVRRGVSDRHIARLLGMENPAISGDYDEFRKQIQNAINDERILTVNNFMSTGGTPDSGFTNSIEMRIFVPKGSQGVYAEPFSVHGMGEGSAWNGITKQSGFGGEFEVLLQRGYRLKPVQFNRGKGMSGTDQIVFMIVGQDNLKPLTRPEIDWSKI